jgi:hypothetical protein
MSNVQFDEPDYGSRRRFAKQEDAWPTKLVLKLGLAKTREQAPVVLIAIGILALISMFFVGFGGTTTEIPVDQPTPDELIGR